MTFIFPALAAVLQAASFSIDKVTLGIKRFTYKNYTVISFPLIFIFNLIIYFIFKPKILPQSFHGLFLILFVVSLLMSLFINVVFYRALKSEGLGEIQTISLLNRVPVIIFAGIFFPDEREYKIIFLALVAVVALVWSHWERHHFHIAKKTWPYLISTMLFAPFGAIVTKKLLEVWNPITLQLFSNGFLAMIFFIAHFKSIKTTPKKAYPYLLLTNVLTTVATILFLFGYQRLGIIQTGLIFSLQPVLVYAVSVFFLKEKHTWKKNIGFLVIVISIVLSQVL